MEIRLYPLAKVNMEIDGIVIEVEAAVSGTLPVSVLLGGNVPQLKQLISSSTGSNTLQLGSDDAMVVITREQSRKQLEEEIVRREQELLSGMEPKQTAGITHEVARTPKWSVEYHTGSSTKEMGNFQDHSTKSNALGDTLLRNFSNGKKQIAH